MTSYIGRLERMFPLLYPESVTAFGRETKNPYTLQEAPHKTWAFVNNPTVGSSQQAWSGTFRMLHQDYSTLDAMRQGGFGWQEFTYIPESASLTNVLSPAQSLLSGISNAGWVDTVQGGSPVSIVGGQSIIIADKVPVIPGRWCTSTVDAAGAASLTVEFCNAAGSVVYASNQKASGVLMQRISVSVITPAVARYIRIRVSGYTAVAQPQVTYTRYAVPWSTGSGSRRVLISGLHETSDGIDPRSDELWRKVELEVREIGGVG